MNDRSKITAFAFFLNFDDSAGDYGKLVEHLIKKGFTKRYPQIGYLVAAGQPKICLDVEQAEHMKRSIESDPERISLIGKYCIVALVQGGCRQIVIGHSPELSHLDVHSDKIIAEANAVIDKLKEGFETMEFPQYRLFYAVEVKTNKKSYQVLSNFDNVENFTTLAGMGSTEMELARCDNEIYLYSRYIDGNTGPVPIIEDMKRKNLPQKGVERKRGWDNIILKPRPNQYLISAEYRSDSIDDVIQKFESAEEQSVRITDELEAKIHL